MRKTFAVALALLAAPILLADYPDAVKNSPRNTPEAKAARKERRLRNTGGFVKDYREYKGQFLFLNSQSIVRPDEIEELTVGTLSKFFNSKFAIVPSERFEMGKAQDLMKKADAQGAVFLIDDPAMPTLFASPEEAWAAVNVSRLTVDKPDRDLLTQRVRREMWRAFGYTLGCSSPDEVCVMKPVYSLKDLDDLSANALSRYPLQEAMNNLLKIGIGPIRMSTYRSACEEGWAPAPTNDYQKAIWESIRAERSQEPTKGIKIQYDPKKGR